MDDATGTSLLNGGDLGSVSGTPSSVCNWINEDISSSESCAEVGEESAEPALN